MPDYTLGLFANMYPAFEGDYRGVFIRQMVRDLEGRGVRIRVAAKTIPSPMGYLPFLCSSVSLARKKDLDLIQAEYIPHSSIVPAILKRRNVPLVLKFHGDDARIYPFENRIYLAMTKAMLGRASHVIAASEEIRKTLIGIGASPEEVTAIHTGVDTGYFTPMDRAACRSRLGLSPTGTVFLFVGRLHPWKGIPELVGAAKRSPRDTFIFIGPGTPPPHPGNCRFPGTVPHGDVRVWLNAADCFVLPTHTEAVPTSVMEAFSCGIPAITTDIGGCPEIVTQNKNGLMVPVGNECALSEAIAWMSDHAEKREQMGRNARITVEEQFDHRVLTDRLINVHSRVLAGRQ